MHFSVSITTKYQGILQPIMLFLTAKNFLPHICISKRPVILILFLSIEAVYAKKKEDYIYRYLMIEEFIFMVLSGSSSSYISKI